MQFHLVYNIISGATRAMESLYSHEPGLVLLFLFLIPSDSTWPFLRLHFSSASLHWLYSIRCSFTLIFAPFALSISGLCLCPGLWDQISFASGLNVCSHGPLHLKGNSFSWSSIWNKIDVGKLHTPFLFFFFLQNVSSIAHINYWRTKAMYYFVIVMSRCLTANNTTEDWMLRHKKL